MSQRITKGHTQTSDRSIRHHMTTMNLRRLSLALVLCSLGANAQAAGLGHPPELPDAKTEVYKTLGGTKLKLYIFNSSDVGTSSSALAAIRPEFRGVWNYEVQTPGINSLVA